MVVAETNHVFLREPAEVYHRQAKHYLSSHQLADFRKCPLLYHRKRTGQFVEEERPAYTIGRAAHTLILEGLDRFEEEFAIGGPINPKTNQPYGTNTKAWADWEATVGKPVLSDSQAEMIARMNEAVRTHPGAVELLAAGQPEGVLRTDYQNMPCQIRVDWWDINIGVVDLKTCDDLSWFEADARRYGYAHQLAFYRAVLASVIGVYMPVHLIAVEKKEPYRCGVWRVSPDTLALAQRDNEVAIDRLKACLADERWPTGYEDTRLFDFI